MKRIGGAIALELTLVASGRADMAVWSAHNLQNGGGRSMGVARRDGKEWQRR
jgi:hypothetical protein